MFKRNICICLWRIVHKLTCEEQRCMFYYTYWVQARQTIVGKMPCLRASFVTPILWDLNLTTLCITSREHNGGTTTPPSELPHPLITSREHEPLHHSATRLITFIAKYARRCRMASGQATFVHEVFTWSHTFFSNALVARLTNLTASFTDA